MSEGNIGLTTLYKDFHNHNINDPRTCELRRLQIEMDYAVATLYGWEDLSFERDFQETKQGLRFSISDDVRRALLDRLLELNHACHADEMAEDRLLGTNAKMTGRRRQKNLNKIPRSSFSLFDKD
jgi:hypothetical protein